ncbi:MAG: hypothetical protein ACI9FN_001270, partial [Saprospiraceae bacterium]
ANASDFGDIELQFENFDSSNYIIQLLEKEKLITESIFSPSDSTILFERLKPIEYNITIIHDRNDNGRWDPGNYILKQQSEHIYRKSLGSIQAGSTLRRTLNLLELSIVDEPAPEAQQATPRTSRR